MLTIIDMTNMNGRLVRSFLNQKNCGDSTLQDIIANNLDDLFPGMEILEVLPFRVTRNAETERDNEDAEDLLEQIQQQLRERRFARVVRLEVGARPTGLHQLDAAARRRERVLEQRVLARPAEQGLELRRGEVRVTAEDRLHFSHSRAPFFQA